MRYFNDGVVSELLELGAVLSQAGDDVDCRSILLAANWIAGSLCLAGRYDHARPFLKVIGRDYEPWAFERTAVLIPSRVKYDLCRMRAFLGP